LLLNFYCGLPQLVLKLPRMWPSAIESEIIVSETIIMKPDPIRSDPIRIRTSYRSNLIKNRVPKSRELNCTYTFNEACGSGLIQSGPGSGSSIFPQSGSGSTKCLNPDPMRIPIRIHKGKFEDKFSSKF
jgi:hypothetical protein